ncbi:MAG: 4-(cytidine 5'-diphospho)-2-C-methyl-D-erythritol kinase [Bacteroidota bacterium]|nr:4-(cytidine 5'-diphospho)-2-C-methyl-D-erythritol kinase [Bacteroidota bacterium]
MKIKAFAKINLGLRILRKREDGYHDIETVFHRINLFDELEFSASDIISMDCDNPEIPVDENNLCLRAAGLLKLKYDINKGVHISLQKNIPVGAGLGGGSSDAAAVLVHLPKFWGLEISISNLMDIALSLGSDVPYFVKDGTAYATGRGEKLEYIKLDIPYWIILVNPQIHVSTAWAYKNVNINPKKETTNLKNDLIGNIKYPEKLRDLITNDFEEVVFKHYEQIKNIKTHLKELGAAFALMSGSGASGYGFFKTKPDMNEASQKFGSKHKIFITEPFFKPVI